MTTTPTTAKALTWDELASLYDKHRVGRKARTLPMKAVMKWALRSGLFHVNADDTLSLRP